MYVLLFLFEFKPVFRLILTLIVYKEEQQTESMENVDAKDDDYNILIQPMVDLSSEYVRFLIEEDKNNTVVENIVKEVYKSIIIYTFVE